MGWGGGVILSTILSLELSLIVGTNAANSFICLVQNMHVLTWHVVVVTRFSCAVRWDDRRIRLRQSSHFASSARARGKFPSPIQSQRHHQWKKPLWMCYHQARRFAQNVWCLWCPTMSLKFNRVRVSWDAGHHDKWSEHSLGAGIGFPSIAFSQTLRGHTHKASNNPEVCNQSHNSPLIV